MIERRLDGALLPSLFCRGTVECRSRWASSRLFEQRALAAFAHRINRIVNQIRPDLIKLNAPRRDDWNVRRVVARVGEDEDGLDVDLGEVAGPRASPLLLREDAVRRDRRVRRHDVVGHDNVLEAVLLSDLTALVALTADDEDGLVVLGQGGHGGVGLDELVGVDGLAEDLAELLATGQLRLARAVGEANVQSAAGGGRCGGRDTYKM